MTPRAAGAAVAAAIVAIAGASSAQPRLAAAASARQVEVGEPFTIELKALSSQGVDPASDPVLKAPGFTMAGPQISQQTFIGIANGVSNVETGLGATWQLVGDKPGHFTIAGPSVSWNGKRIAASPIPIDVVPSSGRPRQPSSPFLLPGGPGFSVPWPRLGPGFGGDDPGDEERSDLAVDKAPDPQAFVRVVPSAHDAVVGEQVTVSFYLYERANFELFERHDAPMVDFVRVPLIKNPGTEQPVLATVGDRKFIVRLLDRVALFPVRAGELHVGSMKVGIALRGRGARVTRDSEDVVLHVTEPPRAGRPPGYAVGDVGTYTMNATVQPRRATAGGTVSVSIRVSGAGYVPQSLRVPARSGVEWLDPEKREGLDAPGGTVSGWRSFGYVVRVRDSGTLDLGAVELPYWDPSRKAYVVASAPLGTIEVTPAPDRPRSQPAGAASGAAAAEREPFDHLPSLRKTMGESASADRPLVEGAWLWLLLAAPPLGVVLTDLGQRALAATRERRRTRATSASTLAEEALAAAAAAQSANDSAALAAAVERALHLAIEAGTALRSRGVLVGDLAAELTQRDVPSELAERAADALANCDRIRFDPTASPDALAELAARAKTLVAELSVKRRSA